MGLLSKQQILDYEVSMIEYSADGLSKPYSLANSKYGIWELQQKIKKTMRDKQYTVRWIGNSETAYLQAYVYVLLAMCTKSDQLILSVKNGLYQLGQRYLQRQHQKLLVEFLCLIQYTRDKFLFLRKYPQVQHLIVSVLKFIENQSNLQIQRSNDSPTKDRKSIYDKFHENFEFIYVYHPNQYTYVFAVQDQNINIIVQKDCYFIVQQLKESNKKYSSQSNSKMINKPQKIKSHQKEKINNNASYNRVKSNFQSRRKQKYWKSPNQSSLQKKKKQQQNLNEQAQQQQKQPSIIEHLQNKIAPQFHDSFQHKDFADLRIQIDKFQNLKKQNKEGLKNVLKEMQQSRKKKDQIWQKVQQDYYQRKKKISQKKKNLITLKKLANSKQQQSQRIQKERKASFNSYSGMARIQKNRQTNKDTYTITKSTDSSLPSLNASLPKFKRRKRSLKAQSFQQLIQLRKNNNFRLSIIQQQNRIKFLNKKQKAKRKPKQKNAQVNLSSNLVCTSNRQTITSSKSITFHYVNKEDLERARLYHQLKQLQV